MELRKLKTLVLALGAGALLTFGAPASALLINDGLTPGVLNTIEDQDREAFIDVDGSGTLSVGDVFIGFVRLDDFLPTPTSNPPGNGGATEDHVYGIISNQILAISSGTDIYLGTTTVVGLRLEDLTGDLSTAGGMFAIYDREVDYGNLVGAPTGTTMKDNIDLIATGDLRLVAGIGESDDFLFVDNGATNLGLGTPTSGFPGLLASLTVGSFTGGLTFLYNNTNFEFAETVPVFIPGSINTSLHQVVIRNGSISGASEDGNEGVFGNAGYAGFTQCAAPLVANGNGGDNGTSVLSVPCGFVTKADFLVQPYRVPEPATLALLGIALVGLGGFTRKARAA